jgi:myo-inositol-1(or 4)-monophosphatase
MAHVANGRTDGYGEVHINSWDVLAGLVIAGEAGALINDFCTGPWVAEGNPILCAAPGIASDLQKIFGLPVNLRKF